MVEVKKPSKDQVAAWLSVVFEPVLLRLSQERYFLEKRTPTFRFKAKRCELYRPLAEYIDARQRPTLTQFFRFNPDVAALGTAHDRATRDIEISAETAHAGLLSLDAFRALATEVEVDKTLSGWRGSYPESDGPALLAEMVINHTYGGVPAQLADAWNRVNAKAIGFRGDPAVADSFVRIESHLSELARTATELEARLSSLRDSLADEHGLPPVPFER